MSLTTQDLTDIRSIILEAFEVMANPRFDALEGRMDSFEGNLETLGGKVDTLEGKVDTIDGRMGTLERKVDGLDRKLDHFEHETTQHLMRIDKRLEHIEGRLEALEDDIKELYVMIGSLQKKSLVNSKRFAGLSAEQKLLAMHQEIRTLATEMGVQLPVTE